MESADRTRDYLLYLPESYDPTQPTPLIFSFHGFAGFPEEQMEYSQWNPVAESENLIIVYPAGTGFPPGWYSGETPGILELLYDYPDDVLFVSDLIDHLMTTLCIDPARIYMSGFSNGAGMAERVACELTDRIAAVGTVSGAYNLPECNPSKPIPILAFHGDTDPIVPYTGNDDLPDIQTWITEWAARNGCDATPEFTDQTSSREQVYQNCNAPVELITILGGGHTWSGGGEQPDESLAGVLNMDVNTTALLWTFFDAHPLGE